MSVITPIKFDLNSPEDAKRWLDANLAKGLTEFFSLAVSVTPTLAKVILEVCNKNNRRYRTARGEKHAKAMREGRWVLTHQGVSFSQDGELNNGQHRLNAVILAGIPVPLTLGFGESRKAFQVLDTQKTRGGEDTLEIDGVRYPKYTAAAARVLISLANGHSRSLLSIENDELSKFVAQNPALSRVVEWVYPIVYALRTTQGLTAAAYLICQVHPESIVKPWFEKVGCGLDLHSSTDPVWRLRKAIQTIQGQSGSSPILAALTIKAWNAEREGRRVQALGWRGDEAFPKVL